MGEDSRPLAAVEPRGKVGLTLPAADRVGIIRAIRRGTTSGERMRQAGPIPRRGGFLDANRMGPFAMPEEVTP